MTPLTEESDFSIMVWSKLFQKLDSATSMMFFVFAKQCQQVYYTYTSSFKKDRSRVD
jgi:hypothetical protein